MRRLSALRQRTRSVDYASDTELTLPRGAMMGRSRTPIGTGEDEVKEGLAQWNVLSVLLHDSSTLSHDYNYSL